MPNNKGNSFWTNVLQSVAIALATAILGGLWKTYLDVHDLKGKVDWLYQYSFPNMSKDRPGQEGGSRG